MYDSYRVLKVGSRQVALFEDGTLVPIIEGGFEGEPSEGSLEGGPGNVEDPGSSGTGEGEVELVSTIIAGVETKVTPEVKELLEKRELEFDRRLSAQGDELGQLRSQVAAVQTTSEGESDQTLSDAELGAQMFTDPRGVFKYLMSEIAPELKNEFLQDAGAELDKRETQSRFWNDFYNSNKDLAKHKDIVDLVTNQEYPKIKSLSSDEGAKHIAVKAREQIVKIVQDFTPDGTVIKKDGFVEGASLTKTPAKKTIEDEFSLSSLIRSRSAKRRLSGSKVVEK